MNRHATLLKRHPDNPILRPKDFPFGPADAVFNPGQCQFRGKTILLLSVILRNAPYARVHVAESDDGLSFRIHEKPLFSRNQEAELGEVDNHPIDCRVTQIGEDYFIVRPGSSPMGTISLLYRTRDFLSAEFVDVIALPNNRVPCLFPEKIGGLYWRLDRPAVRGLPAKNADIWISNSENLTHWGHHRFLLRGFTNWCWDKIGPTPPIKTEKGYLVIIHGVASSCSITSYSLGAILLDIHNPTKIIGRLESYLLTAEEAYEFQGRCPGVVFAAGAIADLNTRRLRVYYGGADTCVGLAEGDLDEIIEGCLKGA